MFDKFELLPKLPTELRLRKFQVDPDPCTMEARFKRDGHIKSPSSMLMPLIASISTTPSIPFIYLIVEATSRIPTS